MLVNNIDRLARTDGIVAVYVFHPLSVSVRGLTSWHGTLSDAISLLHRTDEDTIRLVVGKHTVIVQRVGDETVAVVLPTGHAVAKSLRRMIRRMARRDPK